MITSLQIVLTGVLRDIHENPDPDTDTYITMLLTCMQVCLNELNTTAGTTKTSEVVSKFLEDPQRLKWLFDTPTH